VAYLDAIESELRAVMLLTGSANLDALRQAPRILGSELRAWLDPTAESRVRSEGNLG